jgi:CRP/FNR family transcriptional regulator, anaerobic regulatory protein
LKGVQNKTILRRLQKRQTVTVGSLSVTQRCCRLPRQLRRLFSIRVNTSTTETIMSEAAQLLQHDRSHQIPQRERLSAFTSRPVAGRPSAMMDDASDLHDSFTPFQGFQSLQDPQQRMLEMMRTVRELVQPASKVVRPGDVLYHSGLPFNTVFLINSGAYKLVSRSLDGREQIVSLKFRGDWLGFSGIAHGRHACDAVAMDTGNVSIIPYATLLEGCVRHPELMAVVHEAMSTEIRRERESLMSVCTLASQARVAEFLCAWARSMAQRGLRADELTHDPCRPGQLPGHDPGNGQPLPVPPEPGTTDPLW